MRTETLSETSFIQKLQGTNKKEEDVNDDPEPKLARMSETSIIDYKGMAENNKKTLFNPKTTQVLTFDPSTNKHKKKISLHLDLSTVTGDKEDLRVNIGPKTATGQQTRGPIPVDNKIRLKNQSRQEQPKDFVKEDDEDGMWQPTKRFDESQGALITTRKIRGLESSRYQ